jgi:hypothetical protein
MNSGQLLFYDDRVFQIKRPLCITALHLWTLIRSLEVRYHIGLTIVIGIPNDGTIFHYTNGGILFLSLQKHRRLCDLGWMTMDENEEHHDMYKA